MNTAPSPDEDAELDAELEVIEELVEEAMRPWNDKLTPAKREVLRVQVIEALATHPVGATLIAQLARRPAVEASGEVDANGAPVIANDMERSGTQ